jgi:hypothetical protein
MQRTVPAIVHVVEVLISLRLISHSLLYQQNNLQAKVFSSHAVDCPDCPNLIALAMKTLAMELLYRPTDSGMSRLKQKNSFSKGCILESPKQKPVIYL